MDHFIKMMYSDFPTSRDLFVRSEIDVSAVTKEEQNDKMI
jgi:hypothetical protein